MKVDNFVLLIISIVTLIVISLLTECNRGRLTELENKAIKEIVETFAGPPATPATETAAEVAAAPPQSRLRLDSALPTEPGQWGYQITGITQGKYGGRGKQEILDNIGGHNVGDYITESEKQQYENSIGSDRINITNQHWRNSINSYDCDYELDNDCLWVNPNNIGSEVSKYDSGVFAKAINIETQANYGNCDYNNGEIVTTSTKEEIKRVCRPNKLNYLEDSVDVCNKYYVKEPKNTDLNQNSKVYAKKITYYEGVYGGATVDNSVNTVFKANDSDNNNIDGQDTPNSDDKIIRFKKCNTADIDNNIDLNVSIPINTNRNKSLQITFTRVWSNNTDMISNDNLQDSVYIDGATKWKVEIDDGNWEGLQINDFDNLNYVFTSVNEPLSYFNNKYITLSVKDDLKNSLNNFLTNNKVDIKELLNIDDVEFNVIQSNLYTDENPGNFDPQNCAYEYKNWESSSRKALGCCGKRKKNYETKIYANTEVTKTQMKKYNGRECNSLTTNDLQFSVNDLNNLNLNKTKHKARFVREYTWCLECGGCKCSSDIRLKKDINKIGISPMGIPIFTFRFKSDKQNTLYQGTIAQEIINIIPEAVTMGDNGFYMVDYCMIDVEYKKLN